MRNYLLNGQAVLLRKREIPLIMRRHTHNSAIAVGDEHVVADPNFDAFASEWMRDEQPRRNTFFFLDREFSLGRAASLQRVNFRRERSVQFARAHGERMLRCDRDEGDAHDGVGARGEDVHLAVLNRLAARVVDIVWECEAHALGLADPVFLNRA